MVQIDDGNGATTGGQGKRSVERLERARERGRRAAVQAITSGDEPAHNDSEARVSAAALRLAEATPELSPEAVMEWDRQTEHLRDADDVTLPARGPDGDATTNVARSVVIAEYRSAVSKYRELESESVASE
jgi:hypothetical protein